MAAVAHHECMEEIVRRYLRIFVTKDLDELAAVMDSNVVAHGAGFEVRGSR